MYEAIGRKIRIYRKACKMSQANLGHYLGVSFQQIQKYEIGVNIISIDKLLKVSKVLNVPLYELLPNTGCSSKVPSLGTTSTDLTSSPELVELMIVYLRIKNPKTKKCVLSLLKSLACEEEAPQYIDR